MSEEKDPALPEAHGPDLIDGQLAHDKIMAFFQGMTDVFNQKGKTLAYFPMPDGSEWVWSKKPIVERAIDKKASDILNG